MKNCDRHAGGTINVTWTDGPERCPLCEAVEALRTTQAQGGGTNATLERVTNHVIEQVTAWDNAVRDARTVGDFSALQAARETLRALVSVRRLLQGD